MRTITTVNDFYVFMRNVRESYTYKSAFFVYNNSSVIASGLTEAEAYKTARDSGASMDNVYDNPVLYEQCSGKRVPRAYELMEIKNEAQRRFGI